MSEQAEIGLIGLGVMGQNLALNIADHGYRIAVYNRTAARTEAFVASEEAARLPVMPCLTLEDLVAAIRRPRAIVLMVQAGAATDQQIDALAPLLDQGDIIVEAGNARYPGHDPARARAAASRACCSSAPGSRAARKARATAPRSWRAARPRPTRGSPRSCARSPRWSTARRAAPTSGPTAPAISSR